MKKVYTDILTTGHQGDRSARSVKINQQAVRREIVGMSHYDLPERV
jgi:hypothetical protein